MKISESFPSLDGLRIVHVEPREDFVLLVTFATGERRTFSVKPYLDRGVFRELADPAYFGKVRLAFGTVEWPNEQDFDPATIYSEGGPADMGC